jgi:hypothetical protein
MLLLLKVGYMIGTALRSPPWLAADLPDGLLRVVLSLLIHLSYSMKVPYGRRADFYRRAAVLG